MMLTTFRTTLVIFVLDLALPIAAHAQQPAPAPPKIRAVSMVKFAKILVDHAEKLDALDELTETKSPTNVDRPGEVQPESMSFVVTYRVCDIELTKSLTNSIWLLGEIPGRRITTSIRVDCLIDEWFITPKGFRDPADSKRLLIRLQPSSKLTAQLPDDATIREDLGTLRWEFLGDEEKAKKLRDELYVEAKDQAVARFRDYRAANGGGFASALQSEVQAQHPSKSVRVDRNESGWIVGIDDFFAAQEPAVGQDRTNRFLVPVAISASVILGFYVLIRTYFRGRV